MPLEEYRRKRDFGKTPEPAPADLAGTTGRFVVQRHRATRLHYDFRLEIEGVLVSWAVPKGPTLDCKARRMAIHVEDHPIEYFDFEGVIPAKQYGAGDVIVWDWGTWEPEAPTLDPKKAVGDGELKFVLNGEKVKGRFTIVRTSGRPGSAPSRAFEKDDGEQWLLIHKCDEANQPGWDAEDHPTSVKTGRTNDEVKADREAIWISQAPAATAEIDLAGARTASMPKHIEPMLATLASKPFDDDDWLFEIKWDGFRMQVVVDNGKVKTWTRSLKDAETYFPNLVSPPRWIEAQQAIVDGEVVALDEDGRPDFSLLQTKLGQKSAPGLIYQAFDLLYLDGRSLLNVPLEDRKRLLKSVLREHPRVRFAAHVEREGNAFHDAAMATGLEGIVAKLRRSLYEPGRRSPAWLKIKIRPEQELVVGGWTPGSGNAKDLGAVAVGVYEDGKLRFAGKVGSGFTAGIRRDLLDRMKPLEQQDPPFDPPPPQDYRGRWGGDLKDVTWVRPELVIRAELGGWTRDGVVRQTSYKGVEPGRDPKTVTRETAINTTTAVRTAEAEVPPMPESKPSSSSAASGGATSKSKSTARAGTKSKAGAGSPSRVASEFRGATPDELAALDALGNEGLGVLESRPVLLERTLGLRELHLVGPRVDLGQQLALLHALSFGEVDANELAIETRADRDRVDWGHRPQGAEPHLDVLALRRDDPDRDDLIAAEAAASAAEGPAEAAGAAGATPGLLRDGPRLLVAVVAIARTCEQQEADNPQLDAGFGGGSGGQRIGGQRVHNGSSNERADSVITPSTHVFVAPEGRAKRRELSANGAAVSGSGSTTQLQGCASSIIAVV